MSEQRTECTKREGGQTGDVGLKEHKSAQSQTVQQGCESDFAKNIHRE